MRPLPTLLLLAAVGSSSPAAAADQVFRPGFTPHPFTTQVTVPNGATSMRARGFGTCSTTTSSDEPSFAFTLPEPLTDLRLTVDAPAVLLLPDGTFVCVKDAPIWLKDWKAGRYQVLLHGSQPELRAKVRLDQPARALAEVQAALAKTAELVLSASAAANPTFATLTAPAVFPARSSGIGCGPETLAPLARIKVLHSSTWSVGVRDGASVLLAPAVGGCLRELREVRLEPGEFVLWGEPPAGEAEDAARAWNLSFTNVGRPFSFGAAPTYSLGTLKTPMALSGKTSDGSWGGSREGACPDLPRAPSFYLKGEGVKNVEVRLWQDGGLGERARFHVAGPIEDLRPGLPMRCDLPRVTFRELRGTYAVFVVGGTEPSLPILALARRVDLPVDPMTAPLPVPETLSTDDRALPKHYPFWREGLDVRRFFLKAPPQLFVTTEEVGQPMLVLGVGGTEELRRVDVVRADGAVDFFSAARIVPATGATTKPFAVNKPEPVQTVAEALAAAGPTEDAAVARYLALEAQVNACAAAFLQKNDPEWAKSDELLALSQGEPRSERFAAADKACRASRLEAAGRLLVRQVSASRAKSTAAYLAGLKKRFGGP